VQFNTSYTCGEVSKLIYYEFNASEPGIPQTYANTTETSHFVEKEDGTLSYDFGNNSVVNRNGGETELRLYLFDTDKNAPAPEEVGYEAPKVRFNINNGTSYLFDGFNYTNTSGIAVYYFNPSCSYEATNTTWYGSTSLDTCFKDTSSETYNMDIIGDITPNITYPIGITIQRFTTTVVI